MWDKVDCYPRDHEGNEDGPCKVKERSGMKTRPGYDEGTKGMESS